MRKGAREANPPPDFCPSEHLLGTEIPTVPGWGKRTTVTSTFHGGGKRSGIEKIKGRRGTVSFSLLFHHGFRRSESPLKVLVCVTTNLGFEQKLSLLERLSIFNPGIFDEYDPAELGIREDVVAEYKTSSSTNRAVRISGGGGAKVRRRRRRGRKNKGTKEGVKG